MISLLAYWWYLLIWREPSDLEVKPLFATFSTIEIICEIMAVIGIIWGWLYINEPWKKER